MQSSHSGYLKLIIGPMFSGKSTELLHTIHSYRSIGKEVLVINHAFNNRYDSTTISTHDKTVLDTDSITALNLGDIENDKSIHARIQTADIICIEELQFFEDAKDIVIKWVNAYHKCVVCAGLIADYKCELFGDVGKLIPYADEIHHVKALCCVCNDGTAGLFTQRVSPHQHQVAVGTNDMYRVVCRKHYVMCGDCQHDDNNDDYQVGYSYANNFTF